MKQEIIAIDFAEWIAENEYTMLIGAKVWESPNNNIQLSTERLFELFNKEQSVKESDTSKAS